MQFVQQADDMTPRRGPRSKRGGVVDLTGLANKEARQDKNRVKLYPWEMYIH